MRQFDAVVIGASAGGLNALSTVLSSLPKSFALPIFIVQHVGAKSQGLLSKVLADKTGLAVKEADDKEEIAAGQIYLAPPDYHLFVEQDRTLALSIDEKVNYSRPSIDVLFESAAEAYKDKLIGIILTGASADGARGLSMVAKKGGLTIVQDPETAEVSVMPAAAIGVVRADQILPLEQIGPFLGELNSPDIARAEVGGQAL